ncbi:unnamed protein product, partial [Staurois parvus]
LTSCRPPAVYKRQGGGSPGAGCQFAFTHSTAICARYVHRTQWNTDRCMGPLCEVLIRVISDWPISDHMNSSKQDVTS